MDWVGLGPRKTQDRAGGSHLANTVLKLTVLGRVQQARWYLSPDCPGGRPEEGGIATVPQRLPGHHTT